MGNTGKPVIGLTCHLREHNAFSVFVKEYIDSVFAAGGIPVCIPPIEDEGDFDTYIGMLDGILFTGGADVSPVCYGEEPLREINYIAPYRDHSELGLFKRAYEKNVPIFGICRGNQLINVALGGTLYQDINRQMPDSYGHYPEDTPSNELYHSVNILEGSRLKGIMGEEKLYVNSFHHQAVKVLGTNLKVAALSKDNIIEGIEAVDERYLLGVQWHPECLTKKYPEFLKLFKSFVDAAWEYRHRRT